MRQAINGILGLTLSAIWLLIIAQVTLAQTTQFTYQGKLSDGGTPANGDFNLQFKLFDMATLGVQQGATVTPPTVTVTGGVFTVQLDFGTCASCFNGSPRFLEIAVKAVAAASFTPLAPRQPMTSTPYAIKSLNAAMADGLSVACMNCVTSSQIASAPAGSASSYVQNTTTQQPTADFNISGNGTVGGTLSGNVVNATTQYNIGGQRVFSSNNAVNGSLFVGHGTGVANTGVANSFVGTNAGVSNTSGNSNSFFGNNAGQSNMSGNTNSFFGEAAGILNTTGGENSFFGRSAGFGNASGGGNSFFGVQTGFNNTTGNFNSFFGLLAGQGNQTGDYNSFFGYFAGINNNTGAVNAFFGTGSGIANTTGNNNSFFGHDSGKTNTIGSNNTFVGDSADVTANNLTNATAIGAGALVSSINTVVLGRNNDTVQIPGALNVTGSTTFGGTLTSNIFNATTQYNIGGNRVLSVAGTSNTFAGINAGTANTGANNAFFGTSAGQANTNANNNSFFGRGAGLVNDAGSSNAFFGASAGTANTIGNSNSFFGSLAGQANMSGVANSFFGAGAGGSNTVGIFNTIIGSFADVASNNLNYATAIGADAVVSSSNTVVLGRSVDTVKIPGNLNVAESITGNFTVPATNITGVVQIANGGTGSQTQNFVDLTNAQNIGGNKTFAGTISANGSGLTNLNGASVTGIVANAANATTAGNVTGVVAVANGGTGSQTQNFVDLTNAQNIGGNKTFSNTLSSNVVGIGTTSPLFKFHVKTGTDQDLVVRPGADFGSLTGIGLQSINDVNTAYKPLDLEGSQVTLNVGSGGNVGIGTPAPEQKLHVDGTTEVLSTGAGAGFKFRNRGSTSSADDWVWFSSGNIARFFRAGVGDLLTVQLNPNVFLTKYRFTGQVQVTTLYATGGASPLIISSPDQNCWAITVNNAGQLGTTAISCPP